MAETYGWAGKILRVNRLLSRTPASNCVSA